MASSAGLAGCWNDMAADAALSARVGRAVLVHVPALTFEETEVDVRVVAFVFLGFARAYLENDGIAVRSVLQMMPVMGS
jgi:hypothetical protein